MKVYLTVFDRAKCWWSFTFRQEKPIAVIVFSWEIEAFKKPKNFIIILLSKWDLRKWPLKWQLRERVCKCDTGQKWDDRILKETFFPEKSSSWCTLWQNQSFCSKIQFWYMIESTLINNLNLFEIDLELLFWTKNCILPQCVVMVAYIW